MEEIKYEMVMIPLHHIRPPEISVRENMDQDSFNDLLEDIGNNGIINPLTVKPLPDGSYEIIAGERRYLCAQKLRLPTVPCTIRRDDQKTCEIIKLSENFKREDVNPYDEGAYYLKIQRQLGISLAEIAEASNRSMGYIKSRIDLVAGDKILAEMVRDNMLGIGVALKLNEIEDVGLRHYYANWAIQQGATLRLVDVWVREANSGLHVLPAPTVPVTDPGADRAPNRYVHICMIGGEVVELENYRIIECCPYHKEEVLRAVEIEREMAQQRQT